MEPPKKLIERVFEFCITLAASAYLLRLAVQWVTETAPYLLVCAAVISIAIIAYRVWKHMRDVGKW